MNLNDAALQKMLELQAAMLGLAPVENVAIDMPAKEGDSLVVGTTEFHVLHTPGHTQGSICLFSPAENKLVAGDTLFRDSIGRTDLPGGNGKQILQSIHGKLLPLPGETIVIPGHGDNTTIEREKQFNPFLGGPGGR
jgi:glyoxylase-like metal-dependent hydrolase (beta-lactamase superfamily II)